MASDGCYELALQLQLEEMEEATIGLNAKSLIVPEVETEVQYLMQELQLDKDLREERKGLEENLVREQQVWQDEELAVRLERQWSDSDQSSASRLENQEYDLFFAESRDDRGYVGIGCVIKRANGEVVFDSRECIGVDISHHLAEYSALINGLAYARSLGLRRIHAHGSRAFVYWEVKGQAKPWTVEQLSSIYDLQKQIKELESFQLSCVSLAETEEAITLANYAVEHETEIKSKSYLKEETKECAICFEKSFPSDIVRQRECGHQFCCNCLSQYVETETSVSRVPIRCPHFGCARFIGDDDCRRLVSPTVFDTYATRLTEASIAYLEKVYCPFPGCSAMMCRYDQDLPDRNAASSSSSTQARPHVSSAECMECHRLFCVDCHVPWHADLTCEQYQKLPPGERDAEDRKLFQLANDQTWKRCGKCRSLIIRNGGCSHMTCRCGNEFCYICGTNYQDQKKMCNCP